MARTTSPRLARKQPKGPPKRKRVRYFIQVKTWTDVLVKEIGPYNELSTAERADLGINHNLNHNEYRTHIASRRT